MGTLAMSPPETTTSRTLGVRRRYSSICACRSGCLMTNLYLATSGVLLPTRSIRVQCPQYWGQVDSSSARTLVGYRWVRPSTAHMSDSWRLSRLAYGWDGQTGSRSLNAGAMYRRTGSARRSSSSIVLSIWGGTSIDIVARSSMSRWMSAARSSFRNGPSASLSSRRFFTEWARCHWALSHSCTLTSR